MLVGAAAPVPTNRHSSKIVALTGQCPPGTQIFVFEAVWTRRPPAKEPKATRTPPGSEVAQLGPHTGR